MRKVILYIAMSLDGFIAKSDGSVSWLDENSVTMKSDGGYQKLYQSIDTVLLGKTTYDQITQELSPMKWIYKEKQTIVFTHESRKDQPNITFTSASPQAVVQDLIKKDGAAIWLNGGASIIHPLLIDGLVDELQICILPVSLGTGIALFPNQELQYTLTQLESEGDVMFAHYKLMK